MTSHELARALLAGPDVLVLTENKGEYDTYFETVGKVDVTKARIERHKKMHHEWVEHTPVNPERLQEGVEYADVVVLWE